MDARIDELERLAALHRSGVLTDDEFAAQKARTLGDPASRPVDAPFVVNASPGAQQLSSLWRKRFAFFADHGSAFSPGGAEALRKLPFWTGASIRSNVWGFIFGPLYFLFLGMWKRGMAIVAAVIAIGLIAERLFGSSADGPVAVLSSVFCSMTVNYARYIKVTEGRDEWNPIADIFTDRAAASSR